MLTVMRRFDPKYRISTYKENERRPETFLVYSSYKERLMKILSLTGLKASSYHLLLAACLFGMLATASPLMAQQDQPGPGSRMCILLGMLGGTLPEYCVDGNGDNDELSDKVLAQLGHLRLATVAFHNYDVAMAAGWDTRLSECVEGPAGGMGYHYGNPDQIDNEGQLSLLRPEVLLFEPMEDGSMEFVAVEWMLDPVYWPYEEPPRFLEQDMVFNDYLGLWTLHVWIAKENPEGIFTDYNPEVDCTFAPPPIED